MSRGKGNDLKHDVLAELEWDPEIDASKIGVTAEEGVITLTGRVHSFTDKWNAEKVTKRVNGVKGVANDIEVQLEEDDRRDDTDIAHSALNALAWHFSVPKDAVRVTVTNGWVTLDGDVEWNYQKRAAEDAVRYLRGIVGVTNQIVVKPRVHVDDVKQKIEEALRRSAEVDSKRIIVEATEGSVTLRGTVRTWVEHEDAVNAAWSAPGVTRVVDRISVQP